MKKTHYFFVFILTCFIAGGVLIFNRGEGQNADPVILTQEEIYQLLDLDHNGRAGFFFDKSYERIEFEADMGKYGKQLILDYYFPNQSNYRIKVSTYKGDHDFSIAFIDGKDYEKFIDQFTDISVNRYKGVCSDFCVRAFFLT